MKVKCIISKFEDNLTTGGIYTLQGIHINDGSQGTIKDSKDYLVINDSGDYEIFISEIFEDLNQL